jgi:hypothetical protein
MGLPASFELLFLAFEFKLFPKDLIHPTRKFRDPFQIEKLNSIFLASPSDELPSDLQHGRPTDGAQDKQRHENQQPATQHAGTQAGTCSRLLSHQQQQQQQLQLLKIFDSSFVVGTINGIVSDLVCPYHHPSDNTRESGNYESAAAASFTRLFSLLSVVSDVIAPHPTSISSSRRGSLVVIDISSSLSPVSTRFGNLQKG